jgi:DinB family
MKKVFSFLSLMLVIALTSQAQFADTLKEQLLKDWKRSKLYTLDYLKTMPDARFSFRPQDSIRTFAQQMIHLSQATVSLMEAATGMKIPNAINRPGLESVPSALTKDSVTYFVNLSYDYAIQALGNFEMANSYQYVKRGKFNETRIAWMLKAFEHQAHHRAQTTIYIRASGLKPPNERLFDNMYD